VTPASPRGRRGPARVPGPGARLRPPAEASRPPGPVPESRTPPGVHRWLRGPLSAGVPERTSACARSIPSALQPPRPSGPRPSWSTSPSTSPPGSPELLPRGRPQPDFPSPRPTGPGRSRSSSPLRSRHGCSAGRRGWSPRPTATAGPVRRSPSSRGRSARSAWTRPSGPPGAGPPGRPAPARCSRPGTCTCWGRPAAGRPWACTHGPTRPGQPATLQAGPRREEVPPLPVVAGGSVVVGTPPRPSGSALVVGVVAGAWLVRRCTARWILATSGMG
jgi:hypothetical protein